MISKRAYLVREKEFVIKKEDVSIKPGQLLVKVELCGLCNWELNFWKGTGAYYTRYPLVIGHEWVGTVVECGKETHGFNIGDRVTLLPGIIEGFAEYTAVDAEDCYKLNPDVNPENGMGEPLKCIVTVLRAAAPAVGDYGLVLGCGPMGFWCIQALKGNMLGGLIAVDIDDKKLELAKKFGATHTINSLREDAAVRINEITNGNMCDFVIEGTGIPKLLNEAMLFARNGGRVILMSSHEDKCKDFDFRPAIERGLSITAAHPSSSSDQRDDMRRAIALVNSHTFDNSEIISHRFRLEDINKAFETLENKPKGYIKGIIEF